MEEQKSELEVKNNETNEQISFIQLLKELAETQTTLAKIDAQLAIREGKDQIKGIVDNKRKSMEAKAKEFGANLKQIEENYRKGSEDRKGILEEYKEALTAANQEYEKLLQDVLERKNQYEVYEQIFMNEQKKNKVEIKTGKQEIAKQEKLLKAEIGKATKEGKLEYAKQKIEELEKLQAENSIEELKKDNKDLEVCRKDQRDKIEYLEKRYSEIMEARKAKIDEITEEKNNQLATIPKQNIFQKIMGAMFNKFNGTKKFMQTVIEPMKAKVATIKEKNIPEIKQNIEDKRSKFEKTLENKVEEYTLKLLQAKDKTISKGKTAKDTVLEKAAIFGKKVQTTKDNAVESAKGKMNRVVDYGKGAKVAIQQKGIQAKDSVVSRVSAGKRTFKSVIEKGAEAKMEFIKGAQSKLSQKQEELEQKRQRLTANKTVNNEETEGRC